MSTIKNITGMFQVNARLACLKYYQPAKSCDDMGRVIVQTDPSVNT